MVIARKILKKYNFAFSLGFAADLNKFNYGCLSCPAANLTNHVLIRLTFRSNKCLRLKYPESSHNPPTHPPPQPLCAPTFFASHSVQLVNYTGLFQTPFHRSNVKLMSNVCQKCSDIGQILVDTVFKYR